MARYFDALVYLSNWGSYELMPRIPKGLIDEATAQAYYNEDSFNVIVDDDCAVLDFHVNLEDGGDWRDDERWMPELSPIRDEIMRGDLRALDLGWLAGRYYSADDDEAIEEPPVPPGLGDLTDAQRSLVEFLCIDEAMVRAAAEESAGEAPGRPSRAEMAEWIEELPEAEKNAWLLQLLDEGDDRSVQTDLRRRFREATAPQGVSVADGQKRRTVAELSKAAEAAQREIDREEDQKRAEKEAREAQERKARRDERLKDLSKREPQAWEEVERLIEGKNARDYRLAVALLEDLLDLADSAGRRGEALDRIRGLRERHARKSAFIRRLDQTLDLS